jgi:hypothetical protein
MFKWLDNFLIKFSKKILNRYAPTGEFIAYINKDEEKILKQLGGYGKPINKTGIKSFIFCFIAGTKVKLPDGTSKNIEDIQVGDKVLSWNKELSEAKVVKLMRPIHNDMVELKWEHGITTNTFDHPFYDAEKETWSSYNPKLTKDRYDFENVEQLKVGTVGLYLQDGKIIKSKLLSITEKIKDTQTYIFELDKDNTFFANGYLTHNKGWNPISAVISFFTNPIVALVATIAIAWLFRPKVPDLPDFGVNEADDFETGVLLNKQSNDANIPVIYGERLVGGTRVFVETSGTDNTYLYVAIVLCEGEINSIEEIRVNEEVVTFDGALSDNVQRNVASSDSTFYKADPNEENGSAESTIIVEPHFGTDGQSASSLLSTLSNWGSNHKLSGLCYLAFRFKWNQDVYSGIPKIQAKIKGKKVVAYNSSLVAQTPAFTTNPAWCLLDYLTNSRYGKGLTTNEINLQSFYTASQVCETQVTPYNGSSDINIFDTNAVIDTSKKLLENVRELLKGCRGYLPYTAGKYSLIIETIGSASITITEDDIIGGYSLQTPAKNETYNRVIVSYVNPDRNYQVDEVQFPPIDDSGLPTADKHATMKTDDGGFLLEGRFEFGKVITNTYQAEEMAEVILRRTRDSLRLSINVSFSAYDLAIGDIVNITHSSIGFSAKPFRVLAIKFNPDFTLGLDLVEHQNSHYTWATKTQATAIPTTNLPNPNSIQPPASVTLSDEMIEYADGIVITRLNINIGASLDKFVQYYQVEAKQSTESNFKIISNGTQLRHELLNVIDDATYDVRVKAINSLGVSSTFASASRKIIGATETPANVEDLSVSLVGSNQMELSWTPVADLDISWYEIRYQDVLVGAVWNESTPLTKVVRRKSNTVTVNAQTGTFLIKAVDKLGNSSASETIVTTVISGLNNFVQTQTFSE